MSNYQRVINPHIQWIGLFGKIWKLETRVIFPWNMGLSCKICRKKNNPLTYIPVTPHDLPIFDPAFGHFFPVKFRQEWQQWSWDQRRAPRQPPFWRAEAARGHLPRPAARPQSHVAGRGADKRWRLDLTSSQRLFKMVKKMLFFVILPRWWFLSKEQQKWDILL